MTEYVHAHPREETQPDPSAPTTGGPEVTFDALLPKPGRYRAWLQFQRNDKLTTVSFTFAAPGRERRFPSERKRAGSIAGIAHTSTTSSWSSCSIRFRRSSPMSICQGCYRFNNRAYEQWFNLTRDQLRGRHVRDVVGAIAFDDVRPHIEAALRGERTEFETVAQSKGGELREVHATYVPDRDSQGNVRGFVAMVQDISAQARAARQVRAADERLGLAADAAELGVWSIDGASGDMELSERAAAIVGLAPGRHPRSAIRDILDPDDHAVNRAQVERALRDRTDFEVHYRLRRPDGSLRWLSGRGRGAYRDNGTVASIIGVVQDITPAKELEAALRRQSDENARLFEAAQKSREIAETANRLKDDFLATVSHELRTPLNAIMGWARLLGMGTLDASQQARAIETIERNAVVQQRIIEDILDVSRIVTGKIRLEMSSIDLLPAVQAAIDSVRPAAVARGVTVDTQVDEAIGRIVGDSSRVQQIVWNLVSNAIKFTPRGGAVSVRLRRDGASAELVVADTGKGIPPEFLPHVFDRFRQGDASTTRTQGGLGLGLAIVRHLTELHGGSVEATSEGDGCGATFTIRLPLDDERVESPRAGASGDGGIQAAPTVSWSACACSSSTTSPMRVSSFA